MLIKNGILAFEDGVREADVRVEADTIAEIATQLAAYEGEQVIDAGGKVIMPGGIDVHTHMDLNLGVVSASDDFYTGTVAAACGGTTTIVDHMGFGPRGCSISHQVETYHQLAQGKAVVDYSFHGVLDHVDDAILNELKKLIDDGITSHKFYLTYEGRISDAEVEMLMGRTSELGVMLTVHAEDDSMITGLRKKYSGEASPLYHALSRPAESEALAVERMIQCAGRTGKPPLYIVHLSSGLGLRSIQKARRSGQKNIYAETCPQYLLLDESLYSREDGLKYVMSPPLRSANDREALWGGIKTGDIDTIATDHCPFFYGCEKQLGKGDFAKTPGGIPGVEARIPLMLSQIAAGRLSMEELVSLCCTNPARLFGIYPKKGVIAVGSDADIVVVDPSVKKTLTHEILHENTDYTPYECLPLQGYPAMTISRGEIIAQNGNFIGEKGRGRFLKRSLPTIES